MIPKRAVSDNTTGSVISAGRTDFSGQFNPSTHTQYVLNDSAQRVAGIPTYYHKIVAGDLVEMTAPEKAAVDAAREANELNQIKGTAILRRYANPGQLPKPPLHQNRLVFVANTPQGPALAISHGIGWRMFHSTGFVT